MRALLSVYDKTGIVEFAQALHDLGVELISSGGTAAAIAEGGIPVIDVAELTGIPAILGHRVVTLHPKIHGGILADRDDPDHIADMERWDIHGIDLVVVNLYPFSLDPSIELIDIGGPAMVRAAAKNHAYVGVIVSPEDYAPVLAELADKGGLSDPTRRRLARTAFARTSAYDAEIVAWLDRGEPGLDELGAPGPDEIELPPAIELTLERRQILRYGENPHQVGARYATGSGGGWWDTAVQHGGKEMSYLNVYDTEAAWRLVHSLGDEPAAVVIKHANPCGVARGPDITAAYQRAHACDEVSAFGGIVAVNRPVTSAMAEALAPVFTEVLVAPGFEADALIRLLEKRNLRILEAQPPGPAGLSLRAIDGGYLVQTPDPVTVDRDQWQVVTEVVPTDAQWADLVLAWQVVAKVTSNAIVLVNDGQAVGIGCGQQNRRDAGRLAGEKAAGRAAGGAYASDAFFPFADGLDGAIEAGAATVIQPGGSIRDEEVIAAANTAGLAMVFTGERHFRH
ncbi:MAG TPA: bifunctional phosphoribosylaminoimidazolecarboxamide formyltransferase/IMP cyclohydrolase [Acidimicrobiales bacterium]